MVYKDSFYLYFRKSVYIIKKNYYFNIMFKIIIINLIIIIIGIMAYILYINYYKINKLNNSIVINQIPSPTIKELNDSIETRSPIVYTNVGSKFLKLQKIPIEEFETKVNNKLLQKMKAYFRNFYINNPVVSTYNINLDSLNDSIPVQTNNSSRFLIFQLNGIKQIILFQPDIKNVFHKDFNIFTNNIKDNPTLSNIKNIEVILKPGQMLYIPFKWLYCYKNRADSISIEMTSESLISNLLKKK